MKKNTINDLLNNINILDNNKCWIYQGKQKGTKGYIPIRINGYKKCVYVHAYEHWVQPIPNGLCVLHKCDNPLCCNPSHLFLGTKADNAKDRDSKGRNWMANRINCKYGHKYEIGSFYDYKVGRICKECAKRNRFEYYHKTKTNHNFY